MIGKQGLGLGLVLGLLATAVQVGCGRSSSVVGEPEPNAAAAGQGVGGQGSDVAAGGVGQVGGVDAVGEGGEALTVGGMGNLGIAGEANAQGGADTEECAPGERTCDGPSIRVCSPSGHSTIEKTCSVSEVCSQAECRPIVCVPGSQFCQASTLRTCGEDGTDSVLAKTCAAGEFCLEHDGAAECSETACVANELMCVGNVATRCKPDGSGAKPGGTDCATAAQLCQNGACVDPTCAPGEKRCEHDDVYLCVGGGAKSVLFTACDVDEVCDPSLVACRNRICEPGKLGCDSTRTAVCNALGTGWEQTGKDCAANDNICVDGACKPRVCVPSAQYCQDNSVYQCSSDGLTVSSSSACGYYYHCVSYGVNQAYCSYNQCSPGAAMCSGNVATVCNGDGTGAAAGGTDCGADLCDAGVCKPKICEGYSYFCKGSDIAYCQGGLSYYVTSLCADDAPCGQTDSGPACVPYLCWPGLKACLGNQVGTCADDGKSLSVAKQDCSATDEVCVSESACAQTAVDTVGEADDLSSVAEGYIFADVIDVQSNRKLTNLEANVVLAAARDLRWCVFELVSGTYVSRYEKIVKGQSGSGYLSGGALSYTLKAGKRYLLGVAVAGGAAVPYYDSVPWQPEVSFGKAVGSLSTTYSTSIYGYYSPNSLLYDLRVTTALP
jgi:hypothetical protein